MSSTGAPLSDEEAFPRLLYVQVEERVGGFRWHVKSHELEAPLESGTRLLPTYDDARAAGRTALDRICRQFQRYPASWPDTGNG